MDKKIEQLQHLIDESSAIVFFGGAGVSTESGIPDFRSVDGLYNQKWDYPPETILSHTFFMRQTAEFYRFYREKLIVKGVQPNAAHRKLAELERAGKLRGVITQNIDGLHQAAGSTAVYELHGSTLRNYCMQCGSSYDSDFIVAAAAHDDGIPHCTKCGGTVKPDVVLYEEPLDQAVMDSAITALSAADMLIIGGTSLTVYPAAGLIHYFHGDRLVLINQGETREDGRASLVIREPIGAVCERIVVRP
ncbi:MAG: NAD-dependent protein deacylase [Treponema sp.]|nr:NAD-dependent protein deacylase [Treponema sp.]